MKNTEILRLRDKTLLSRTDQRRRLILRSLLEPMECPNCAARVTYFEAAGIDIDDLDLNEAADANCACPSCKRGLVRVVPVMGSAWRWKLIPVKPSNEGYRPIL